MSKRIENALGAIAITAGLCLAGPPGCGDSGSSVDPGPGNAGAGGEVGTGGTANTGGQGGSGGAGKGGAAGKSGAGGTGGSAVGGGGGAAELQPRKG
jgi:hypothetical protein